MPAQLATYISDWATAYSQAYTNFQNAANCWIGLANVFNAHGWTDGYNNCLVYYNTFHTAAQSFMGGTNQIRAAMANAMYWINTNWSSGGSVTMDAILTAMLSASFENLTEFMGILEAYKMAVWNAPFNAEYYAALARGFVKWQ